MRLIYLDSHQTIVDYWWCADAVGSHSLADRGRVDGVLARCAASNEFFAVPVGRQHRRVN